MSCSRSLRRAALATVGVTLLLAGPASAHPFIQGGEAPIDSSAELTLTMAHGCASEVAGEGDPTTEIALEVPDWMRILEVPEADGWTVTLEPDDVEVEVVTWSNPDADVAAPAVTFEAVVDGEPGEELYLAVFQGCADDGYRWIGTPDDPADDPAVRLQLAPADPARPAPAPEASADSDPADDTAAIDPDDASDVTATEDAPDAPDPDAADATVEDGAEALADPRTADADGVGTTPIIVAVIVLVLGGIGVVVVTRRRDVGA